MTVSPPREATSDAWSDGAAYEAYIGRWSRLVARDFLSWLAVDGGRRWLDVGAGTGALSATIAATAAPQVVVAREPSAAYAAAARRRLRAPRVHVEQGDACAPVTDAEFDVVVSGLVVNFVADAAAALRCMARAVAPGGPVAAYVWDYAGRMQMLRHFWDAAAVLDHSARELDEGARFPLCGPGRLAGLWRATGLHSVETTALDVVTHFRDFDDYWSPFLGGQGPAPTYLATLAEPRRRALREALRAALPVAADGSITLVARAWAVRGRVGCP